MRRYAWFPYRVAVKDKFRFDVMPITRAERSRSTSRKSLL